MGTNVTLNGVTHTIPAVGESNWGQAVSDFLVALASGVLQKAGGSFTLTADVDFGATFGLKAPYFKSRSTPATTGIVRLGNTESVSWRNAANSADIALKVNASNLLEFNGNPILTIALGAADTVMRMNAGGTAYEFAKITDANVDAAAAISWTKVSKTGSNLTDLATRQHSDLTGVGTNTHAQIDTALATAATHQAATTGVHGATNANTPSAIVQRDASGNFSAGTITANLTGNASGTAANVTGVVALANGGTGQTSASTAINALVPSQTGNANKVLTTDGTSVSWGTSGGAGSGEINAMTNGSGASDTTGWTPTGSGSPTVTRLTSNSPLDPVITTALRFGGGSAGAYIEAAPSIPAALRNRKLKIEWHQTAPTTGEWKLDVYNSAGSTRYSLSTDSSSVTAIPGQTGKFTTTLDMDAGTSVKVRFVRVSGSGNLDVTNVILGPGIQPQGAIVTEWQSYTPTFTGFGTASNVAFSYRRVGTVMQVRGRFTTGTNTASAALISLPSGYTVDTTYFGGAVQEVGTVVSDTAANNSPYTAFAGTGYTTAVGLGRLQAALTALSGNSFVNSSSLSVQFEVPIAEWAGSGTMNVLQQDNLTNWASYTPTLGGGVVATMSRSGYYWRRVGDSMEVRGQFAISSISAGTATVFTVSLPTGYMVDSTKIVAAGGIECVIGTWSWYDNSTAIEYVGAVVYGSSGIYFVINNANSQMQGADFANNDQFGWWFSVPITQFANSGTSAIGYAEVQPGIASGLVSANGLKGSTSGSAIAAGYVGEVLTFTSRSVTTTVVGAWRNESIAALTTLTAGAWLVLTTGQLANSSAISTTAFGVATNQTNDSSGFIGNGNTCNVIHSSITTAANQWIANCPPQVVYVAAGATQTLYPKAYGEDANTSVTFSGFAVRIA